MDFLRKTPQIEWRTFWMILFLAGYTAGGVTILSSYGALEHVSLAVGVLLLTIVFLMTLAFGLSRALKRTDIIDVMWGVAITIAALGSFALNPDGVAIGFNIQTVATGLVLIWGVRLSYHILRRFLISPEDPRYQQLRKKWRGSEAVNTYLRIFMVQAVLAVIVAAAVICINLSAELEVGIIGWIGLVVWVIGFLFESIGDYQLKRFLSKTKSKGALMTGGLWRYTRHPNYFGEATQWWGVFIIALSVPLGWLGILSPVVITYLLLYVSGVPMAEKRAEVKRGWKAYVARTSKFVPNFQNKN